MATASTAVAQQACQSVSAEASSLANNLGNTITDTTGLKFDWNIDNSNSSYAFDSEDRSTCDETLTNLVLTQPPSLFPDDFWDLAPTSAAVQDKTTPKKSFGQVNMQHDGAETVGMESKSAIGDEREAFFTIETTPTIETWTSLFGDGVDSTLQPPESESFVDSHLPKPRSNSKDVVTVSGLGTLSLEGTHSDDRESEASKNSDDTRSEHTYESERTPDEDGLEGTRYELRPAARVRPLACGATWLDQDQSGDYDPSQRSLLPLPRLIKRKRKESTSEEDAIERLHRSKKLQTLRSARQNGLQLIVVLRFSSDEGFALLRRVPDQCPPEYWNQFEDTFLFPVDDYTLHPEDGTNQRLRNRHEDLESHPENTRDLTGHPSARGCKACRDLAQVCPMLEPDGTYPCHLCVEDGFDCELVVEPKKKRSCQNCRARRVRCSYLDTEDHSAACERCQEVGHRCIAGPAIDPSRTRIGHDGKPATIHESEPQYRSTNGQRAEDSAAMRNGESGKQSVAVSSRNTFGSRCSRGCDEFNMACNHSEPEGQTSNLHHDEAMAHRPSYGKSVNLHGSYSNDPQIVALDAEAALHFHMLAKEQESLVAPPAKSWASSVIEMIASAPGKVETFRTRLLHPITFNASNRGLRICNWCEDPLYGMFGIGEEMEVKVRQWPNGKGCTELSRARATNGMRESRQCPDCTLERVSILTCDDHSIRPIEGLPVNGLDWAEQLALLMACDTGVEGKKLGRRFCIVCPQLAAVECCARNGEMIGCGMRLCASCAHLYNTRFRQDLQAMVRDMDPTEAKDFPLGVRADYDFFKPDSYLIKQILTE